MHGAFNQREPEEVNPTPCLCFLGWRQGMAYRWCRPHLGRQRRRGGGRRIWMKRGLSWNTVFGVLVNPTHPDGRSLARRVARSSSKSLWNSASKQKAALPFGKSPSAASPGFFGDSVSLFWAFRLTSCHFSCPPWGVRSVWTREKQNSVTCEPEAEDSLLIKESLLSTWGLGRWYPC